HGCLTALLVLMIVANSAAGLLYLSGSGAIKQVLPGAASWVFPVMGILGLFNLVCAVALLKWRKWGFWGLVASSIVASLVNMSMGVGVGTSVVGMVGIALLYGVLQIGGENRGWPQLD
ncbi:MAG: hypothetical protein MUQ65_10305, partial [Armatimonadetes bacterium]|nr:hypothetical protein [Armatimonadota bacterium]